MKQLAKSMLYEIRFGIGNHRELRRTHGRTRSARSDLASSRMIFGADHFNAQDAGEPTEGTRPRRGTGVWRLFGSLLQRAALLATILSVLAATNARADEPWVRITSEDKRASVLFPSQPDKVETLSRKSPAGTIQSRRATYERAGVLLTITQTDLPRAALAFTTNAKLLKRAAEGVLSNFFGEEVSQKRMKIGGEPALTVDYRVPDYDDPSHPGYRGIAIALLVDQKLYVVNGILTSEDPAAEKKQKKLLNSIRVVD